jgi:phosphoribosylaminoimidazolecarboxamide formyltransferase/IMP cyclohydrolase
MIRRALISVSNKDGLIELAKALKGFQYEIISTGGTAETLREAGVEILSVSDYTGFPEMMEGRLKTLHPRIHGAILGSREKTSHIEDAKTYGIKWIDLVVVNLYPFEEISKRARPDWAQLVENIDIGGPAMIRAAAKNHRHVTVVVSPKNYKNLIQRIKKNPDSPFDLEYRWEMAARAFRHCAIYDSLIASTLSQYKIKETYELERESFPKYHFFHGRLLQNLRYGENPHQKAAAYRLSRPVESMPISKSLQGKELSFNNYLDADSAWSLLKELPPKSAVIIKHNTPCGVGVATTALESFQKALSADPESSYGGVVAISDHVDAELASALQEHFFEIVCAESFGVEAREILEKKKNLRIILFPKNDSQADDSQLNSLTPTDIRKIHGGYLLQDRNELTGFHDFIFGPDAQTVTQRSPSESELKALRLAWVVCKNVKSNAIVIGNENQSLGIAGGEVNRKFATKSAVDRAKNHESDRRVCASDGFFPFKDSIEILAQAGITSIVQPGGSIRDEEVIEACNRHQIAMIFTKLRHFKH